uniref:Uncharacterized protein n=1 Tax=Oryza sativa subsp. japonica TaxID=39947 RepID=Q6Z7K7_ORYSJ|nr:hypothetical protein [Oryza sativa Japonica Group]
MEGALLCSFGFLEGENAGRCREKTALNAGLGGDVILFQLTSAKAVVNSKPLTTGAGPPPQSSRRALSEGPIGLAGQSDMGWPVRPASARSDSPQLGLTEYGSVGSVSATPSTTIPASRGPV